VTPRLVVVTSGFPRVSETFALNELVALQQSGMLAAVFATKPGDWSVLQPQVDRLRPSVRLLPEGDAEDQATALVHALGSTPVSGVHGYFAHQPAAVAAAAAARLGVPYGFSTHALDVRKIRPAQLAERAGAARGVLTCNTETAAELRAAGVVPRLVPHGVDVARFAGAPPRAPRGDRLRVLAVGRLVEKKGFPVLLRALARLDGGAGLRIVGTGPQEARLRRDIDALGLGSVVELVGPRTHRNLPAEYAAADVVAVPSVVDGGGDRDGLPNVVLEAMACGRAVVASDVAAVSDAVLPERTGLLVPPGDAAALAEALRRLGDDGELRRALGESARRRAVACYDLIRCTRALCRELEALYA
jgi:glycosyltransferase involved in cell wall biosynthesis